MGEEAPYGVDSVFCELLPDGVNYDGKWEGSSSDKECSTEVCPYEKHVNIENHPCAYGFTGGEKAPGHAFVSGHLAANMPKLMDGFFCPHHALDGSSACFKANAGDVHQDDGVMVAELDAGGIYPENSEASFACRMPKGERCIIAVQGRPSRTTTACLSRLFTIRRTTATTATSRFWSGMPRRLRRPSSPHAATNPTPPPSCTISSRRARPSR